jgi:hypothetical protein
VNILEPCSSLWIVFPGQTLGVTDVSNQVLPIQRSRMSLDSKHRNAGRDTVLFERIADQYRDLADQIELMNKLWPPSQVAE